MYQGTSARKSGEQSQRRDVNASQLLFMFWSLMLQRMTEKSTALSKDVSNLHTLFNGWKAVEAATATHPRDAEFVDLLEKSSTITQSAPTMSLRSLPLLSY